MNTALISNKYRITRRIGGGSFGEIYMGVGPSGEKVAIKFERQGSRCPQLRHEFKVYRELANCLGFCSVYYFGVQDNYNVMVMDLLGPSLEDLFNRCSRKFSLKTVLQLADQILDRIDCLHSRHLIHRDIKPANFTIGLGDSASSVFCVDFGLSKRYRHPKTLQHIPHRDGRSLTGTPRYASINNHLGIEQSRRDDLESVGYVLIYFLKGSLPWQGLKAKNAQKKYRMILEKKQQISIAQLCQGCPSQFAEFLAYTRSLKFDAKPDLPYLRKLFRDLYHSQGLANIGKIWDWEDLEIDYGVGENGIATGGGIPSVGGGLPAAGLLRPGTAAAVGGTMMDTDILGVDDDPYEGPGTRRPNTSSGVKPQVNQTNSSSWLFGTRQNTNPTGSNLPNPNPTNLGYVDLTMDSPQQRRPHTAHGSRAGGDPKPQQQVINVDEENEDDHVVAGARAMMRYRRTRNSNENVASQVPVTSSALPNAAPGSRGWTGGDGKASSALGIFSTAPAMTAQQVSASTAGFGGQISSSKQQQQQQQAPKMTTGTLPPTSSSGAGWLGSSDGRPKSAGLSASAGQSGLTTKLFSNGNNPNDAGGTTGGGQGQAASSSLTGHLATLSYGSLKNRFLSGSSANVASNGGGGTGNLLGVSTGKGPIIAGGSGAGAGAAPPSSSVQAQNTQGNSGKSSSKIFGLSSR